MGPGALEEQTIQSPILSWTEPQITEPYSSGKEVDESLAISGAPTVGWALLGDLELSSPMNLVRALQIGLWIQTPLGWACRSALF